MASKGIGSILTESFVNRFVGLSQGSNTKVSAASSSSNASLSNGLRLGARLYGTAIQGLNSLISFINLSKSTLETLEKLTDKLINVTERATRIGTSSDARNTLDLEYRKLAGDFKTIVSSTKVGDKNLLNKEGLSKLFTVIGLDEKTSESIADLFAGFLTTTEDKFLASDTVRGGRPLKTPSSAYNTSSSSNDDAAGTFLAATTSVLGAAPSDLTTADINFDGKADIVTLQTAGAIEISVGNGNGTFQASVSYDSGLVLARRVRTADFNNDQVQDLVAQSDTGLSLLLGNINGSFKAGTLIPTGTNLSGLTLLDVNRDNKLDVVTLDTTNDKINVFLGNADGTFKVVLTFVDTGPSDGVSALDMNGDGNIDLVTTSGSTNMGFFAGNGNGTFEAGMTTAVTGTITNATAGDFNNDSTPDLMALDTNGFVMYRQGNGDGTFKAEVSSYVTGDIPSTGVAADVNNDGSLDFIASADLNFTHVLLGNGDGSFKIAVDYDVGATPRSVSLTDVTGDGVLDIVTATSAGFATLEGVPGANARGLSRSLKEFDSLFSVDRNIRTRPNAYQILADLKGLRSQIETNKRALDEATVIVGENVKLIRAAGFAFLEAADSVTSADKADQVALLLQAQIRQNAGAALSQAENLEPITVAALTLSNESFTS